MAAVNRVGAVSSNGTAASDVAVRGDADLVQAMSALQSEYRAVRLAYGAGRLSDGAFAGAVMRLQDRELALCAAAAQDMR